MAMDAMERYQAWLDDPLIDADAKQELRKLAGNEVEIEDRFYKWLQFGTGGLRGTIGAGSNRMNIYTVRLVTQALASSLKTQGIAQGGVAIAYDSRHMSVEFTTAAAGVLIANGIPVYVFDELAPTPLLSYAVRYYQASAGIVITASHNPPQYNGYKVYNRHGNQMLTDEALAISSKMAELGLENVEVNLSPKASPLWRRVGYEVIEAYYASLLEIAPEVYGTEKLSVLYTPLHGTGGRFVPEVLQRAGFTNVTTVPEQMEPNGDFPTVSYPNPEDPKAFELAFSQTKNQACDVILATDPDADRMGVAVNNRGEWVLLNGNQVGVLITEFLLSHLNKDSLNRGVIIKTIVTTDMVEPICQEYGVEVRNTLTGFKYIGTLMDLLPQENKEFIFGFEESYGYLAGTHVRDKDAVLSSLLIAQVAAYYKQRGLSLVERLEGLFAQYGYYLQDLVSYTFDSSLEAERSRQFIGELQKTPITAIGPEKVIKVLNYETSLALDLHTQKYTPISLPKEGVLQWITEEGSKITLRPSGTEPKMKLYFEVKGTSRQDAEARLATLKHDFDKLVQSGLKA